MASSGKILLTTSRNPTPRIRTFCQDLARVIPNVVRVNRGKMSNEEVAEKALENSADRVVIVDRWHGGPGKIKFFQIGESGLVSVSPIIHIAGIKLQRELGALKVKPSLSMILTASSSSGEVLRVVHALSKFFYLPILPMDEMVKTSQTVVCVSRDEVNRITITFMAEPKHVEVGPRIIVSSVEW